MTTKIQHAIDKLNQVLPLHTHFALLDSEQKQCYQSILRHFIARGRAPHRHELRASYANADHIVQFLADKAFITLNQHNEIVGCYPFTMEPRVHRVFINDQQLYAMCALDALAPAIMFKSEARIHSLCAVTGQAIRIDMHNKQVSNPGMCGEVHVGINWQAANSSISCADSLCTGMLFLVNKKIAEQWASENSAAREIFNLDEAIAFADGFFTPLLC
ncbi:MAG: organomercurial lyase [Thioalkalispiraceae bacterium]|jgi:hypothetical protein